MNDFFNIYWSDETLKHKISYGDAKLALNKVKNISFEDSIKHTFKNYYKDYASDKEKLIQFFKDFQLSDEFEILHLNSYNKDFVNFRNNFNETTKTKKLSSFVIVGKKEKNDPSWKSNSAAIFFDIFFEDNERRGSKEWIKFRISRIEFLI